MSLVTLNDEQYRRLRHRVLQRRESPAGGPGAHPMVPQSLVEVLKDEPQGSEIGFSESGDQYGFDHAEWDHEEPTDIEGKRVGQINDPHIPFHSVAECNIALRYLRDEVKVDTLIFAGDMCDLANLSRHGYHGRGFNLSYELDTVEREVTAVRRFMGDNCAIHWLPGNHELWHQRHLRNIARMDDKEVMPLQDRLHLDSLGITYHPNRCGLRIGKHHIFHGDEIRAGGKYVARNKLDHWLASEWGRIDGDWSISFGHHHTVQQAEVHFAGNIYRSYAVGCLRQKAPDWNRGSKDQHGFAHFEVGSDGRVDFRNRRIHRGIIQ